MRLPSLPVALPAYCGLWCVLKLGSVLTGERCQGLVQKPAGCRQCEEPPRCWCPSVWVQQAAGGCRDAERRKSDVEIIEMLWPEGWKLALLLSLVFFLQLSEWCVILSFLLQLPKVWKIAIMEGSNRVGGAGFRLKPFQVV